MVKNVTGYDLCKLLTGSYGTLAMSELTFVLPRAETSRTVLAAGPDRPTLLARCSRTPPARRVRFPVPPACPRSPPGARRWARSAGAGRGAGGDPAGGLRPLGRLPCGRAQALALRRPGVEFADLEHGDTVQLWREIRDVALLPRERPLWRLSLAPTAAAELAGWTAELTPEQLFDWAGGLVWLAVKESWAREADAVRAALEAGAGTPRWSAPPTGCAARSEPFQPQPAPLRACQRPG
ncbi:MAG: hypothetical protein U1E17_08345 [Geminicoccaceae bacterium]